MPHTADAPYLRRAPSPACKESATPRSGEKISPCAKRRRRGANPQNNVTRVKGWHSTPADPSPQASPRNIRQEREPKAKPQPVS
jgi:hypothetical protein